MGEALQPQVIEAAARRDLFAIFQVFYHTRDYACFVARCYVKNEKDLMAALTDGYVQAIGRLTEYDIRMPFSQWLHSKIAAKALALLKAKKVKFTAPEGMMMMQAEGRDLFPVAWLDEEQKRWQVLRVLEALPDPQRAAVVMHYLGGMNPAQIAQAMGVDERAAMAHLTAGKAQLTAPASDGEAQVYPVMTQLLEREARATVMPREMAKAVFQDLMLYFIEHTKMPKEKGKGKAATAPPAMSMSTGMSMGAPAMDASPMGLHSTAGSPYAMSGAGSGSSAGLGGVSATGMGLGVGLSDPYSPSDGAASATMGGGSPMGFGGGMNTSPMGMGAGSVSGSGGFEAPEEKGNLVRNLVTFGIVLVLALGLVVGYYLIWKNNDQKAADQHLAWYASSRAAAALEGDSPDAGEDNLEIGNGEYLDPDNGLSVDGDPTDSPTIDGDDEQLGDPAAEDELSIDGDPADADAEGEEPNPALQEEDATTIIDGGEPANGDGQQGLLPHQT